MGPDKTYLTTQFQIKNQWSYGPLETLPSFRHSCSGVVCRCVAEFPRTFAWPWARPVTSWIVSCLSTQPGLAKDCLHFCQVEPKQTLAEASIGLWLFSAPSFALVKQVELISVRIIRESCNDLWMVTNCVALYPQPSTLEDWWQV